MKFYITTSIIYFVILNALIYLHKEQLQRYSHKRNKTKLAAIASRAVISLIPIYRLFTVGWTIRLASLSDVEAEILMMDMELRKNKQ